MASIVSINFRPEGNNVTIEIVANFTEVSTEPLSARVIGSLASSTDSIRADYSNYDVITANGNHSFVIKSVDLRRFPIGSRVTYYATLLVEAAKKSEVFIR